MKNHCCMFWERSINSSARSVFHLNNQDLSEDNGTTYDTREATEDISELNIVLLFVAKMQFSYCVHLGCGYRRMLAKTVEDSLSNQLQHALFKIQINQSFVPFLIIYAILLSVTSIHQTFKFFII